MAAKKKPAFGSGGPNKGSTYDSKYSSFIQPRVDFKELAERVKPCIATLVQRILPQGRFEQHEYVALNPTRHDHHLGSFRINTRTGCWADFATHDKGRDFISLWAYIKDIKQLEAAGELQLVLWGDKRCHTA